MNLVSDGVRVGARIARVEILLGEDRLARAHVHQANLHGRLAARLLDRSEDDGVGTKLAPRGERDIVWALGCRDRGVRIARDHVELALEVEVVPQDLADRFRHFRGIG